MIIAQRVALMLIWVKVSRKLHTRSPQGELRHAPTGAATQGRGWQFAIEGSIAGGETAEVAHSVPPCDLGDAGRLQISAAQRTVHLLHSAEAEIAARGHPELLLAAPAQHPVRDAEHRADFGDAQKRLHIEHTLEPGENIPMP